MKVLLFGASGVIGQGVLDECLLDPRVDGVLSVVRLATGEHHGKLRELVHADFFDFSAIESELSGFDACFFCLGISSTDMNEESYRWVTYDVTITVAKSLARLNPAMTFIYVLSLGAGGDGRVLWARVKSETESALRDLPVKAYMLRPARVMRVHGIHAGTGGQIHSLRGFLSGLRGFLSKEKLSLVLSAVIAPLFPLLRAWFPQWLTTTEQVGRAMLQIARQGAPQRIPDKRILEKRIPEKRILENSDINAIAVTS